MILDFNSPELRQNPFHLYARLRREEPVTIIKGALVRQTYFVTRYEDVANVLKDPRFSSDQRKGRSGLAWLDKPWMPSIFRAILNSMVAVDDPDHRRLRDLVQKAFTPGMIARMASRVESLTNELLDKAASKRQPDLISAFALPIPLTVICDMMGIPAEKRPQFQKWMASLKALFSWKGIYHLPKAYQLIGFFRELIELRRRKPQDDLTTALVQAEADGDRLSEDELVAMLFFLLVAGHETTTNLIGNGVLALLEFPDQLQKLHDHPGLIDSAVEEMLRYGSPVEQLGPRLTLEDVELCGVRIPKGSPVTVGLASANRDDSVFENPDQFDITRSPNRHLALGLGVHYCLGAPLARLETRIAIQTLVQRYPGMRPAIPIEKLQWHGSTLTRGLRSLPVKL